MKMRKNIRCRIKETLKSAGFKRLAASVLSLSLILSLNTNVLISVSSFVNADEITDENSEAITTEPTETVVAGSSDEEYVTIVSNGAEECEEEDPDESTTESVPSEEDTEGVPADDTNGSDTAETSSASDLESDEAESREESEVTVIGNEITYAGSTASGITVSAVCPEGAFAEEVSMKVSDIDQEEAVYIAAEELSEDNAVYDAVAVDISFVTEDGRELEPEEGYAVRVSIILPDSVKLDGEDYVLLHVKEDGAEQVEDAVLTDTQADFTTDSFSLYVVTAVGEIDKDKVHDWLDFNGILPYHVGGYIPNTDRYPYLMRVGETFTLRGYASTQSEITLDSDYTGYHDHLELVTGSEKQYFDTAQQKWVYEATYRATSNGLARLKFADGTEPNTFYVAVYDTTNNPTFDVINSSDLDEYSNIKNPYVVSDWGQLSVLTPKNANSYYVLNENGNYAGTSIDAFNYINTTDAGSYAKQNFTAYMRDDGGSKAKVCGIHVNANGGKDLFFKPLSISISMDHADVEIANGGTFTSSSIYVENGQLFKRVDTFNTYVENVNYCKLFQANDTPVQFYHKNGTPHDSSVTGYKTENYGKDPTKKPSDTQYELTSKYKFIKNQYGDWVPDGDQSHWSDILYNVQDVDHAEFDLQLYLEPAEGDSVIYRYDESTGKWVIYGTTPIPDDYMQVIDHVVFELDHTAVLDAYNRCPLHNGMDFSVQTNHSKVQVQATKELVNGNMSAGDFEFEIVEFAGTADEKVLTSSKNQADGKIVFDVMSFEEPGVHVFTIRETSKTSRSDASNIHFDTKEYTLKVVITMNEQGLLEADVELPNHSLSDVDFKFSNYIMMPLPNTGGTGTVIFYVAGGILIVAALVLVTVKITTGRRGKNSSE